MLDIKTGINAGPVYNPQQVQGGLDILRNQPRLNVPGANAGAGAPPRTRVGKLHAYETARLPSAAPQSRTSALPAALSGVQPLQMSGAAGGTLSEMLSQLGSQTGNRQATEFERQAAFGNRAHELASQRARAQAGIQWGNLYNQDQQSRLAAQQGLQAMLLNLIGNLV